MRVNFDSLNRDCIFIFYIFFERMVRFFFRNRLFLNDVRYYDQHKAYYF